MARVIKKEVTLSDSISFTVPVDCTAIRVLSTATTTNITMTASSDGLQTDTTGLSLGDVSISSKCFGRDISITGSLVTKVVVLLEVN